TSQKISTKLSIACSPLGAVFGAHQNFAPGTGFSSISYPEFGLDKFSLIKLWRHDSQMLEAEINI
ncbi:MULTISPECIES: hypothetical protein, partial [unclassified Photorhabdus]|uniref:hypothetical protein n=1 Tax=unclassified Photorhabdus TaxID=2620880 RepID=UPI000DCB4F67